MPSYKPKFGPGTVVALLLAAGVLVYGFANKPDEGNIQAARERAQSATKPPPLVKPEPADLLTSELSQAQGDRIRKIHAKYLHERRELLAVAKQLGGPPERVASLDQLQGGLQEYAAVSREIDRLRAERYREALAITKEARR